MSWLLSSSSLFFFSLFVSCLRRPPLLAFTSTRSLTPRPTSITLFLSLSFCLCHTPPLLVCPPPPPFVNSFSVAGACTVQAVCLSPLFSHSYCVGFFLQTLQACLVMFLLVLSLCPCMYLLMCAFLFRRLHVLMLLAHLPPCLSASYIKVSFALLQFSCIPQKHTHMLAHTLTCTHRGRRKDESLRDFLGKFSVLPCEPHYCTQVEYERTQQTQNNRKSGKMPSFLRN